MIYIVEGCTCSGKSTFARNLSRTLGYNLLHYSIPTKDFTYFTNYRAMILNVGDVVFDRFFFSELVYQKAFDRDVKLTQSEVQELEFMLKLKGCKVIFMNPPFIYVAERFLSRGDDHVKELDRLEKVYEQYQLVMRSTSLPLVEIVD